MSQISPIDRGRVLDALSRAPRVYLQAAVGEPLVLRDILSAAPEVLAGIDLTSCLLPGMNEFDYAALEPRARLTTFLLPSGLRASFEAGRVKVRPLP